MTTMHVLAGFVGLFGGAIIVLLWTIADRLLALGRDIKAIRRATESLHDRVVPHVLTEQVMRKWGVGS